MSDPTVFCTARGGRKTAGSNAPGAFLVFVRFSIIIFFGGHLLQTSSFRSAKEILVVSFATQARACILSDRNKDKDDNKLEKAQIRYPSLLNRRYSILKRLHFLAVLLCLATILTDVCVENYKEFNGVNFSSTRARTNMLASFNLKAGTNSRSL